MYLNRYAEQKFGIHVLRNFSACPRKTKPPSQIPLCIQRVTVSNALAQTSYHG
jgi:hypothetical protein